jgi:hypothetical protein
MVFSANSWSCLLCLKIDEFIDRGDKWFIIDPYYIPVIFCQAFCAAFGCIERFRLDFSYCLRMPPKQHGCISKPAGWAQSRIVRKGNDASINAKVENCLEFDFDLRYRFNAFTVTFYTITKEEDEIKTKCILIMICNLILIFFGCVS